MGQIIAFTGPISCGKSTAARYLTTNYNFIRHYFAKPLKEMLKLLGLTEEHVNGSLKEKPCWMLGGASPRYAMQTLGTEWGRNLIHGDLWAMAWRNTRPGNRDIVVDDLRFPNELEILRSLGGIIVKVVRPGLAYSEKHESEAHDLPYDFIITNDGTIEDLYRKIEIDYPKWIIPPKEEEEPKKKKKKKKGT
jgi:hypothetical protein